MSWFLLCPQSRREIKEKGKTEDICDAVGKKERQQVFDGHFPIEEVKYPAHKDSNCSGDSQTLIGMKAKADEKRREQPI